MTHYAWIITHVNVNDLGEDCADEVGVAGPRRATPEMIERAKKEGFTFRLMDGDGIWYYRGKLWIEPMAGQDYSELTPVARQITMNPGEDPRWVVSGGLGDDVASFGPLEDWGTPNAGAVDIQFRCTVTDEDGDTIKVWASL